MINNRDELIDLLMVLELALYCGKTVVDSNPNSQELLDIRNTIESKLARLRFYLATNN